MAILIADSGSTKTDWLCGSGETTLVHTQGINPFHQDRETIREILLQELLPQVNVQEVTNVCFYGSGVRPELEPVMRGLLNEVFPQAGAVEAHSDLLGAARALCGRESGIACILGTGANSCFYDGTGIVQNTPAMGYILGDEGSGASLGKRLVHDLYKGILSKEMVNEFEQFTGFTMATVIDKVYRQPMANRFLASLSGFIHSRLDHPEISRLVTDCFVDFFRFNIAPYQRPDLPVSFVGSIAWYYQEPLREAADSLGYRIGKIVRSPLDGLRSYHSLV